MHERIRQASNARQLLAHDLCFVLNLQIIRHVLPMAAAAHAEVLAAWCDALGRRLDKAHESPAREASTLLDNLNFGLVAWHGKRHEDDFAFVPRNRRAAEGHVCKSNALEHHG